MKKSKLFFVFLTTSLISPAQKVDSCYAGVYFTKEDLLENRISHKINTQAKGYKFTFPLPADLTLTVKIIRPDSTVEFKPGQVFGYSECGKKCRYYAGGDLLAQEDYYRIEEIGGLVIYSSVFNSGSENFYSLDVSSPIHRLLVKNLEKDFADQPGFIASLKHIKQGLYEDISKRDEKGNFIINQLYSKKIKKKSNSNGNKKQIQNR